MKYASGHASERREEGIGVRTLAMGSIRVKFELELTDFECCLKVKIVSTNVFIFCVNCLGRVVSKISSSMFVWSFSTDSYSNFVEILLERFVIIFLFFNFHTYNDLRVVSRF